MDDNARFCGRCCICARVSEELFGDTSSLVVIEVHNANSVDRVTQPVVCNSAMRVVRGGGRRGRQLLNSGAGRRAVVDPVCSVNIVLVHIARLPLKSHRHDVRPNLRAKGAGKRGGQ
ncbi:hypothetical protein [Burkholderia sp. BCC1999]|uniref:hypothetical protein n=1 Tax=Burkholderia sp. BCC1999 TaxID=2817448 RepID=UPI002AC32A34|nr:hypothetical protein [Burkholderia sp. BCC1999]